MLALPAEVTMANARQVQQDLLARCRQLQGAEAVRVQAGALTRFDSSVLAVLLELERATGGRLELEQVPQRLESLAQLFERHDLAAIKDQLIVLRYLDRYLEECDAALDED